MKPYVLKASSGLALLVLGLLAFRAEPATRYVNLPGLVLVVVGTLAAGSLAHSFREVVDLIRRLPILLRRQVPDDEADLEVFLRVAEWHRLGRVRPAEQTVRQLAEPLLRNGAELVINRTPPAELSRMLHWKVAAQREREQDQIKIVRTLAAFAPAFGMLGTLFGLIQMMYALDASQMERIGAAMGFALLTTVYGLVLANLILKPIAARLEHGARERLARLHVQAEAVRLLQERCHPVVIQDYWRAYSERSEENPPVPPLTLSAVKTLP